MPKNLRYYFLIITTCLVISSSSITSYGQSTNERVKAVIAGGVRLFDEGQVVEGLGQFELAKSMAEKEGLEAEIAEAYNWIGNAHNALGDPSKARIAYKNAYNLAESLGDSTLKQRLNINLGILSSKIDDHNMARGHLKDALDFFAAKKDTHRMVLASNNLGFAYLHTFKLDSAKLLLESSIELAAAMRDTFQLANIHANIGALYFTRDQWKLAISYYGKSILYYHSVGLTEQTRDLYFDILRLHKLDSDFGSMQKVMDEYFEHFDEVEPRHEKDYAFYLEIKQGRRNWWLLMLVSVALTFSVLFGIKAFRDKRKLKKAKANTEKEADDLNRLHTRIANELESIRPLKRGNVLLTYDLIARGKNQTECALELEVSEGTISDYVKLIREKLEIKDIREHAINLGVLQISSTEFRSLFQNNR